MVDLVPKLILGPPGTGKTTKLISMVREELARGTAPDRIAYISFTRKAAEEARTRAEAEFGLKERQLPYFKTIHSLCFAALGLSSAEILEGAKLKEFGDWIGIDITGKGVSMDDGGSFGFKMGDRILFMENLARVRGIPLRQQYEEDNDNLPWSLVEKVARGLAEFKKKRGLHDFTDLLNEFVRSDWNASIDALFVDEAQDLSYLQWRVVWKLMRSAARMTIAGDDDQAIYRWAGADVQRFIDLSGDVSVLHQSWRVPSAVQPVAFDVLKTIKNRREKEWSPREGDAGVVKRVRSLDEIDFTTGEETLVLSRNVSHLRDDAMALLRQDGVIYNFKGFPSVKRSVIDAILGWEALRRGDRLPVAQVLKIYEHLSADTTVARGHKKLPGFPDREAEVDMADLKSGGGLLTDAIWHDALDRVSREDRVYMLKALRRGDKLQRPSVSLSTIHGSKGGEADHVVLLTDVAYRTMRESQALFEDEARVFYVATTRAKKRLTLVAPQTRHAFNV